MIHLLHYDVSNAASHLIGDYIIVGGAVSCCNLYYIWPLIGIYCKASIRDDHMINYDHSLLHT